MSEVGSMMQRLVPIAIVLALAAPPARASTLTISTPVAISAHNPLPPGCGSPSAFIDAEVEPSVAVSPVDPDRIVAAWQQDRLGSGGARSNVVAASNDGGATWTIAVPPGMSACSGGAASSRASDPWVSVGRDGIAYLASLVVFAGTASIVASRSGDGGVTWDPPVSVASYPLSCAAPSCANVPFAMSNDKEAVTADPIRPGTAYLVWKQLIGVPGQYVMAPTMFSRTTDGGRTWSLPLVIHPEPLAFQHGHEIVVLPDRALVDVFSSVTLAEFLIGTPAHLRASRSEDGGLTWSPPVTIADQAGRFATDPDDGTRIRSAPSMLSADAGPDGAVHVAWEVNTSPTDGAVLLASSPDGGRTWSAPKTVTARGTQALVPSLAAGSDGSIAVTYYDFRNDVAGDGELTTHAWFAHSHDDGATWDETHMAGPFDMRTAPNSLGPFLGDYQGLARMGDGFAAVFAQARPQALAGATDIFFAKAAGVTS